MRAHESSGSPMTYDGTTVRSVTVAGLALLVVAALALLQRTLAQNRPASKADPKEVYQDLRNLALQISRAKAGLPATPSPTTPWGVIMDWSLAQATATVVAFADGHASIYLSSGGGFLGGGDSHESVRNAAKRMVSIAAELQPQAHPASSYPLPEHGGVMFYFLTDSGVFRAAASEDDLRTHRSPLARLGDAGQAVITEYRQVQQSARPSR